jgi:hypothetical protein
LNPFASFLLETASGLIGVFAGVVLALWTERKREARQNAKERDALAEELVHSRKLVLSSVVKNTSQAKQLAAVLSSDVDPYLFEVSFELAVWEATQIQFMRLAAIDERVLLSRYFDQVGRLNRLMDFHRQLRVQLELRQIGLDSGDRSLLAQSAQRLHAVAEDVRIDGLVIVNDLGEPVHKRLLGIQQQSESAA